jgi:hypothetical protein
MTSNPSRAEHANGVTESAKESQTPDCTNAGPSVDFLGEFAFGRSIGAIR